MGRDYFAVSDVPQSASSHGRARVVADYRTQRDADQEQPRRVGDAMQVVAEPAASTNATVEGFHGSVARGQRIGRGSQFYDGFDEPSQYGRLSAFGYRYG